MVDGPGSLEFCSDIHPMYSAERSAPVFVSIAVIVGSTHFAFRPHLRLVHLPRVVRRLEVPAQAPLQFRSIPLDPSPDGDVIHQEPAPDQKLLRIIFKSSWRLFAVAHGTKLGLVPPSVSWLRIGDRIVSFCRSGASLDYDYGDSHKKGRSLEK
jgi:hypothetical protein